MGLALLVLGLILFLGPHVFVTMRAQRDTAVKRIGEWPYKGLFAVVTVVGLFVLAKGFALYRDAGPIEVGQGLIGQCAADKRRMLVTELPANAVPIGSALFRFAIAAFPVVGPAAKPR